jgi:sulfur carrier protein
MNIRLNNKQYQIEKSVTLEKLLKILNITETKIAIEVNRVVIPKSNYNKHMINDNDKIEIITAIGGG